MFQDDDYASLFLADGGLLLDDKHGAGGPGAADDAFSLFPFVAPTSAGSPSAQSTSSSSADSHPSSRAVSSPGGAEATLVPADMAGVDDLLFGGAFAGFDDRPPPPPQQQQQAGGGGWDAGLDGGGDAFGGTWASSSQHADADYSFGSSSASPHSATSRLLQHSQQHQHAQQQQQHPSQQQQQQFDPFFSGLDLSAFSLPPLPDDLGAPGAFLPPPPLSSAPHSTAATPSPPLVAPQAFTFGQQQQQQPPAPAHSLPAPAPSLKRKASSSVPSSSGSPPTSTGGAQAAKPVSDHNAIERKYRDTINDAHVKLRDAVPVLRVLFNTTTPVTQALDTPSPTTGLIDGQQPETKQGKATVLTAAREYIFLLQLSRAAERRYAAWLEERLGGKGLLRGEWEADDETTDLDDGYLRAVRDGSLWRSFPHFADRDDDGAGAGAPKKKRARPGAGAKAKAAAGGAKEAGKVLLALGLGLGVGLPLAASSTATAVVSDVDDGASLAQGRLIGRTLARVAPARWAAPSAETLVGGLALVCALWLLASVVRHVGAAVAQSRAAAKAVKIERALKASSSAASAAEDDADDTDADEPAAPSHVTSASLTLKQALGADSTFAVVRQLLGAVVAGRLGLGKRVSGAATEDERERAAWVKLAEEHLAIPTDLPSYLFLSLVARRLAAFLPASSPARGNQLALLAIATHALDGAPAHPSSQATAHWSAARTAGTTEGGEDEVLALSLADACVVCPYTFTPTTGGGAGVKARIGDALALRDLRALWADVQSALVPRPAPSTTRQQLASPTSPVSASSSTTATPAAAAPAHPFAHLLVNPLAPAHRASIGRELAALERATAASGRARELVVVSRAVWAVAERDTAGLKAGVFGVLAGEKASGRALGAAARALVAFAGVKGASSASDGSATAAASTDALVHELDLTLAFLLSYFGALALLSAASSSPAAAVPSGPNKPLLQATLRARALLHQLDALALAADALPADSDAAADDDGEGADGAHERFGAALFGIGRWAAGWKDEREDDDSGFEDGW